MRAQTIILFGRSGSGKGTQAELLLKFISDHDPIKKTLYIETGQKVRDFMTHDNYSSKLTADIVENGKLLPEFMPIWIWSNYLIEHFTGEEHLVLDGLSRRPHEAPILDSALRFYNREYPTIIVLDVSREWAAERLKGRARADDNDADIRRRVEWYDTNVVPAIEYFRNNGRYSVIDVNGEQEIERVHSDIVSAIDW
ncbi:MAG TPA: nucleoside monophosphate kinase [Candidatus Paceibacterota bacterium]|nr:nucleoside monophosphate kinase [Candidatus Paceibacterota bacterium]